MPSRKQRRRRAKEKRHEWEFVEIDPATGEERALEPDERKADRPASSKKAAQKTSSRKPGRVVNPPSWNRVLKRGLVFAPLMFLTVTFLDSSLTVVARVIQTALLLAFFIPFSYAMDTFAYRTFIKRGGVPAQPK